MSKRADTALIRAGAQRFAAAGQELQMNARRMDQAVSTLMTGTDGWSGEGAESYQLVAGHMREDVMLAGQAFQRTATVLSSLAMQLDHVNDLQEQADKMRARIHSLEMDLWGADEQRRAAIHEQISRLSYQRHSLEQQADSLEQQANATASRYFDDIGSMANRLHFGHGNTGSDSSAWEKAGGFLKSLWGSAKDKVEDIVDDVTDVIEEAVDGLQDAIAKAVGELDELIEEGIEDLFAMMPDQYREYADIAVGNFGDFAEGAVFAYINNATFGLFEDTLLDDDGRSSAYYLGRIVGDAAAGASGVAATEMGAGAVAGGLGEAAVTASGVVSAPLAVPGLAVAAVGGVAAAYGAGVSAKAVESGVKDWQLFRKSLGEGGSTTKRPQAPRKPVKDVLNQVVHDDGSITYTMKTEKGRVVDVTYNKDGYPDFSPFEYKGTDGKAVVEIEYTGSRNKDFDLANNSAGFEATPKGYTWHHVEDGKTMQLVENDVHKKFQHTGGVSTHKNSQP